VKITRKKGKILYNAIRYWEENSLIDAKESERLRCSIEIVKFDWMRMAKYSFWISIVCVIIAVSSVLADRVIMEVLERIFDTPDIIKCIFMAAVAAVLFYMALSVRVKNPAKIFSSEALFFLGVLSVAGSIAFLGKALDTGTGHFSLLILLSFFVYGVLGFLFRSRLVWSFSIISIGAWFGTETGYVSGWGAYYLGMNYPLRFVLFGCLLLGLSLMLKKDSRFSPFFRPTYIFGLLYLFIALWILSIFGNYGDMNEWYRVKQVELFHWSILFGLSAIAAIVYGLRYDDSTARGFGITFLFINLYTRYFEYFWDSLHKAIFFILLAVSFWIIGTRAEKIWSLDFFTGQEAKKTAGKNRSR
jgi:hypothetical protein